MGGHNKYRLPYSPISAETSAIIKSMSDTSKEIFLLAEVNILHRMIYSIIYSITKCVSNTCCDTSKKIDGLGCPDLVNILNYDESVTWEILYVVLNFSRSI